MLKLFNTKTRKIETFIPRDKNRVLYYTCGPSVYNFAHIGNLRTFFWEDVLKRSMQYFGYNVVHAMPLSDIEDKAIAKFNSDKGRDFESFIMPKIALFKKDMLEMNIMHPTYLVRFKTAIPWVKKWVSMIEKKGYCKRDGNGNLLFRVGKVRGYGNLVRLDAKKRKNIGDRLEDDYSKEGLYDFALWKAADKQDGKIKWDSPWGEGRPGTHSYCSAIAYKWLGKKIDIHAGGVDNIFPHHENEMAQSGCVAGGDFVKYWFHVKHLTVNKRKMSKSIGNVFYLKDLKKRGIGGQDLRYFYLTKHYRKNQNFDFHEIRVAKMEFARLKAIVSKLIKNKTEKVDGKAFNRHIENEWSRIVKCVNSDLDMPHALGIYADLAGNLSKESMPNDSRELFIEKTRAFERITGLVLI